MGSHFELQAELRQYFKIYEAKTGLKFTGILCGLLEKERKRIDKLNEKTIDN